jgi:NAD(P)-dependent dehydrogenase (short-subunit alcohol dehydrogenase family)
MQRLKLCLVAIAALVFSQAAVAQAPGKQQAVLVTGASTGIGLAITQYLAQRGFYVYAGARKDEDLKRLEAMDNVSAVRLDVTKQEDVDAAAKFVAAQGRGLYGVINNAGVGLAGELTKVSDADVLWLHDVNVMGPLRVNRTFIDMLKQSKGRTAIIGSLSGFVTKPQGGVYSMTKFATEAYAETLELELKESGVASSIIDPGAFRSRGREKIANKRLTGKYELAQNLTDEQKKVMEGVQQEEAKKPEPTIVAEQVHHFLTSATPRPRYMAAPDENTVEFVMRTSLGRVAQLNASQPDLAKTRDELVKMLDEALTAQASVNK